MAAPLGIGRALFGIFGILAVSCAVAHAADPLAQAIVDAVAVPPPKTPRQLLDAAIKTNDVEAFDASIGYWKQLVQSLADAGDGRNELLADLGDRVDPGALKRLERTLGPRDPDVLPAVQAILEAAALRRRDPKELARAIEDLRSDSSQTRLAATDRLGRTGLDALPALVDLLQSTDPEGARARNIARGLVRNLGVDARRVLVAWLGSNDIDHWPGVITALDALEDDEVMEFLLAPALAEGVPPLARSRAITALEHHARRCGQDDDAWEPPTRGAAIAILAGIDSKQFQIEGALDERPENALALVIHGVEIYLPLEGMLDLDIEKKRLQEQLAEAVSHKGRIEELLAGPFTERAPEEVVERERAKLRSFEETAEKIKQQLDSMS